MKIPPSFYTGSHSTNMQQWQIKISLLTDGNLEQTWSEERTRYVHYKYKYISYAEEAEQQSERVRGVQRRTKVDNKVWLEFLHYLMVPLLDMQIWICQKQQQDVNTNNPAQLGMTGWFSWCRSLLHYYTVTELTPETRPRQIDVCHRRLMFITGVLWFIVSINNDVYKRKYTTNSMTPENKLRDCLCDMMEVLNFWPHGSRFNWATSWQELICKAIWDHVSLCSVVIWRCDPRVVFRVVSVVSRSVEWRCESPVELLITTHIRSFLSRFCALAEGFVLPLENRTKDHLKAIALANLFCLRTENHLVWKLKQEFGVFKH